jgi:hypothetical protein
LTRNGLRDREIAQAVRGRGVYYYSGRGAAVISVGRYDILVTGGSQRVGSPGCFLKSYVSAGLDSTSLYTDSSLASG